MDKEQALIILKELHKDAFFSVRSALETLIPEIKEEANDEKIRKELIEHCKNQAKPYIDTGNECPQIQSWITWLEKQSKETSWKPSKEEMDVLYSLAYITNQYDEHKEEVITRLYQDLKREFFNGSSYENMFPNTEDGVRRRSTIQVLEYARSLDTYNQYGKADIDKNIAWLEKKGERDKFKDAIQIGYKVTRNRDGVLVNLSKLERVAKKETLCDKCRKAQPSNSCQDITALGRCYIEGMNTSNKVEPEFEDGDWVTDGIDNYLIQGKAKNAYVTTTINDEVGCIVFGNAKQFHLWTIQDAKDGDVIYIKRYRTNDEWLLIFKKIEGQNNFIDVYDYYAFCITSDNTYHESIGSGCWGLLGNNIDIVCPATKEQRNLLFSKIHSTGYEWNEKEKVIVKIQKEQ